MIEQSELFSVIEVRTFDRPDAPFVAHQTTY